MVERHLAKVNVASSNLVFRSKKHRRDASDLVRHFCYKAPWPSGKAKVCNTYIPSSSLGGASKKTSTHKGACFFGGTPSPDSNEVLGKNAEHFDVAFENGVFESRVWVANIAWTEKSLPRSHSQWSMSGQKMKLVYRKEVARQAIFFCESSVFLFLETPMVYG